MQIGIASVVVRGSFKCCSRILSRVFLGSSKFLMIVGPVLLSACISEYSSSGNTFSLPPALAITSSPLRIMANMDNQAGFIIEGSCENQAKLEGVVMVRESQGSGWMSKSFSCGQFSSGEWAITLDISQLKDGELSVDAFQADGDGYIENALRVTMIKDTVNPMVIGLADDRIAGKTKRWSWSCMDARRCSFRYRVNTNSSHHFQSDDAYGDVIMTESYFPSGTYYIHVQAKDMAGNESLVKSASAIFDNISPRISDVAIVSGSYAGGGPMDLTVTFNEAVVVAGVPRLGLMVGSILRYANYLQGGGSESLVFRYTVDSSDSDSDGIAIPVSSLDFGQSAGSIQDQATNNAALKFVRPGNLARVIVDGAGKNVIMSKTFLSIAEKAASDTYTIRLNTQPVGGDVTIAIRSSDNQVVIIPTSSLTFSASTWNQAQVVRVVTVDDEIDNPSHRKANITHIVSGADYASVTAISVAVMAVDDDEKGVTISRNSFSLGEGESGRYTLRLASKPEETVSIVAQSSDSKVVNVSSTAPVTFDASNWQVAQEVRVAAVDNDRDETEVGVATISHAVSGGGYADVIAGSVVVMVSNDDEKGTEFSLESLTIDEGDASATYTIALTSQPMGDVRVGIASGNERIAKVSPIAIFFTMDNWRTSRTVTVTTVDDDIDNAPNRTTAVDHTFSGGGYNQVAMVRLPVTATDDDAVGISLSKSSLMISENAVTATYRLGLNSEPVKSVMITLVSSDPAVATVSPGVVVFNRENWNVARDIMVTTVDDMITNGTHRMASIAHTAEGMGYSGIVVPSVVVMAIDNEVIGVTVFPETLSVAESVGTASYTIQLNARPTGAVNVVLSEGTGVVALPVSTLNFTQDNWFTTQSVVLNLTDDDIDHDPDRTVTVRQVVSGGGYDGVTASGVSLTVTDDEAVGVTLSQNSFLASESSGSLNYTMRLDSQPTETVEITLSGGVGVVTLSNPRISFTSGNWQNPQVVRFSPVNDSLQNSLDRMATLAHSVTGGGYAGATIPNIAVVLVDDDAAALQGTIGAGAFHSCGVLNNASLKCWGRGSLGQLGQGARGNIGDMANEMGANLSAIALGLGRTVRTVVGGEGHTCALLDDASIKCWGRGDFGQLGQGATAHRGDAASEMGTNLSAIALGTDRSGVAVAAGGVP